MSLIRTKTDSLSLIFTALGGCVILFIVAPLAKMFLSCTIPELTKTIADTEVRSSICLTLTASMAATLIFAIAAIPLAYLLARKNFPLKTLITGIIDIPIVIPHSAAGIALLGIVSRNTLLGQTAEKLGFSFVGSTAGIIIAMAFVSLPFLINSARDGFAAVPERLEKAALNLGASPTKVFFTISLPLAARPVITGLTLMWARGMSEFGAVLILAYYPMITPVLIYERFGAFGLKYARPVAAVFIAICLIVFIALRLLAGGKKNAQR